MNQMKTSEGSPRAALLQQAVAQGQNAAQLHPLSTQRPALHNGPVNGVMTILPPSLRSKQTDQKKAALMSLVMHLMAAQRGGNG